MSIVQKIIFPYPRSDVAAGKAPAPDTAIFFGTDFYNLPIGSDQKLFTRQTHQILTFIHWHFLL